MNLFTFCQSERFKKMYSFVGFFITLHCWDFKHLFMFLGHFFCELTICILYFLLSFIYRCAVLILCISVIYFINIHFPSIIFLNLVLDSFFHQINQFFIKASVLGSLGTPSSILQYKFIHIFSSWILIVSSFTFKSVRELDSNLVTIQPLSENCPS